MSTLALHAPASIRRDKKRLAVYEQKHEQLRREVDAVLMRQFEERFILEFEQAFQDEMQRDPDFASHLGMV